MTDEFEIIYDRDTRDYAIIHHFDGGQQNIVGYGKTYHDAERTRNQKVFDYYSKQCQGRADAPASN